MATVAQTGITDVYSATPVIGKSAGRANAIVRRAGQTDNGRLGPGRPARFGALSAPARGTVVPAVSAGSGVPDGGQVECGRRGEPRARRTPDAVTPRMQ